LVVRARTSACSVTRLLIVKDDRQANGVGRHPIVGDVRGSGLFIGVELVRDRNTLEPAGAKATFVANRMRDEGILIGTDGPLIDDNQ
jgi:4-aminobutyrate aminotransferase-like enzyme